MNTDDDNERRRRRKKNLTNFSSGLSSRKKVSKRTYNENERKSTRYRDKWVCEEAAMGKKRKKKRREMFKFKEKETRVLVDEDACLLLII